MKRRPFWPKVRRSHKNHHSNVFFRSIWRIISIEISVERIVFNCTYFEWKVLHLQNRLGCSSCQSTWGFEDICCTGLSVSLFLTISSRGCWTSGGTCVTFALLPTKLLRWLVGFSLGGPCRRRKGGISWRWCWGAWRRYLDEEMWMSFSKIFSIKLSATDQGTLMSISILPIFRTRKEVNHHSAMSTRLSKLLTEFSNFMMTLKIILKFVKKKRTRRSSCCTKKTSSKRWVNFKRWWGKKRKESRMRV